ncbi:MAG: SipW-dependent-type signal peptide-containing protein [Leucobacter sp.]
MSARRPRRSAGRLLLQGIIAAVLLLGVGGAAAWAAWNAIATVPGDTITAGTLDLQFADTPNGAAGTGTAYAKKVMLPVTNLTPGESAAFTISPKNGGTADFRYAVRASTASTSVLSLRLYTGTPGTQRTTYPRTNTCTGVAIGALVNLGPSGSSAITSERKLSSGAGEALCVVVAVRADAPASAAGTAQSVILDFSASQETT